MSHEITSQDNMLSVRITPWHDLGVVLPDHPTIDEAIRITNTEWKVYLSPAGSFIDGLFVPCTDKFSVVRDDIHTILGIVGKDYNVLQCREVWYFAESFCEESGCKIETAGTLKGGRTIWILLKDGTKEFLPGDPIEQYHLIMSGHDGCTPFVDAYTSVRVVCNNTLNAALNRCSNMVRLKHTSTLQGKMKEIQNAIRKSKKYDEIQDHVMYQLLRKSMTGTKQRDFLENILFAPPKRNESPVSVDDLISWTEAAPRKERKDRGETIRRNNIESVSSLIETGAGTDIPGVRGTGYGLLNAVIEHMDHLQTRRGKTDTERAENRFASIVSGPTQAAKTVLIDQILAYA